MKQKKNLIYSFLLGSLVTALISAGYSFISHIEYFPVFPEDDLLSETVKHQNDEYYKQTDEWMDHISSLDSRSIPSDLSPYISRTFVRTDYHETTRQCHVLLDFYFSEAAGQYLLNGDQKFFVYLDSHLLWSNDNISAQLWSKSKNKSFSIKRELDVNAESISSFSIILSQLKREDFPCHIQIYLKAPWNDSNSPTNLTYQYRVKRK